MKMVSPLAEIISDLSRLYPNAAPEEICDCIIKNIETIFPEVLRAIRLPTYPSPSQMRIEELRLARLRKNIPRKRPFLEKTTMTQHLAYAKQQLNGHKVDTSLFVPSITYGDRDTTLTLILRPAKGSVDVENDSPIKTNGTPSRLDLIPSGVALRFKSHIPYTPYVDEEIESYPRVVLDTEVEKKVVSDPLFTNLLKVVEVKIRNFVQTNLLKINFILSIRTDVEIPEWKKIILEVRAPDMDFDQKMVLWEKLDNEVRQAIHDLKQYVNEPNKEKLETINRNFFIHMELS